MSIVRELGVANIIEGSVFRTGDQVRITVRLIDAATNEHLWAENYRRDVKDMLALHGELARAIAGQVAITLMPKEVTRLTKTRQENPEAYETYLKGIFFLKQLNPELIPKGLQLLHDAIGIDPRGPCYIGSSV